LGDGCDGEKDERRLEEQEARGSVFCLWLSFREWEGGLVTLESGSFFAATRENLSSSDLLSSLLIL